MKLVPRSLMTILCFDLYRFGRMEVPSFSATAPPTPAEVTAAGALFLFDEAGQAVRLDSLFLKSFGDLDGHKRERRTALLFIRHFYCGLCMDYNSYVASKVNVEELEREGIEIIVVGCGSWELIAPSVHPVSQIKKTTNASTS